jgi:hypothetical protein
VSFKDIALPLVARGVRVIPCRPLTKETYLSGGPERGTLDTAQILAWDKENPRYNVGSLGTLDGVVLFDCDAKGLVKDIERETGHKMPATFTVKSANKGTAHLYFLQTDRSRAIGNKTHRAGELRCDNLYVVGPGSEIICDDGTRRKYEVFRDIPLAPFPDFLGDWILTNSSSKKGAETGEVDQDSYRRLRKAYQQNLDPEDLFGLPDLTIASLHPTLHSLACLLHDGRRTEDEVTDILERISQEYGHREARGRRELEGITEHAFKKAPCEFTLDEGHPVLTSLWVDGLHVFRTEEEYKDHIKERLYAQFVMPEPEMEEGPELRYPIEVWAGTDYAEFAERCGEGNYIPREFLIEALKTVTGAVVGSALSAPDLEGAIPRFYTVLMGGAGSGKGTSISWASSIFKDVSLGGSTIANLLWSPATKIQEVKWKNIGACEEGFNSAPGLQRSNKSGQKRWLQTFEELDHMIEGSGIEGSGKALMGVNRQLYDREEFVTTTTGTRDAIAGKAQNSILAATTPELWTDMFAGKSVRGSGLFQRFNLLASTEHRKKGSLRKPRLEVFKNRFAARVVDLDANPISMTVPQEVEDAVDEWFNQEKFETADSEVRGRLNVLAWRNALHLAWQRDLTTISMREMEDALKLSDYQFDIRRRYTPAEGESQGALVENKIRNFLEVVKKAHRREVVQRLNLRRYGGFVVDRALGTLQKLGEIQITEETTPAGRKAVTIEWLGDV